MLFWFAISETADAGRTWGSTYFSELPALLGVLEALDEVLRFLLAGAGVGDTLLFGAELAGMSCTAPFVPFIVEEADNDAMEELDTGPVGNDLLYAGFVELLEETAVTQESSAE